MKGNINWARTKIALNHACEQLRMYSNSLKDMEFWPMGNWRPNSKNILAKHNKKHIINFPTSTTMREISLKLHRGGGGGGGGGGGDVPTLHPSITTTYEQKLNLTNCIRDCDANNRYCMRTSNPQRKTYTLRKWGMVHHFQPCAKSARICTAEPPSRRKRNRGPRNCLPKDTTTHHNSYWTHLTRNNKNND